MTDFKPGEIVNISAVGARVQKQDARWLETLLGAYRFPVPLDGPGITVERAAGDPEFPATWAGGHALVIEYGDCELVAKIERLTAEISDWHEAASYWEGPEDCIERECEEFFDEDGNDRLEKDHCSHMTAKFLTPEEVAKAISGSLSGGEAG